MLRDDLITKLTPFNAQNVLRGGGVRGKRVRAVGFKSPLPQLSIIICEFDYPKIIT